MEIVRALQLTNVIVVFEEFKAYCASLRWQGRGLRCRGLRSRSIFRRSCRTEALGSLTRSEVLGALGGKRPLIWGWLVDAGGVVVFRVALKSGIDFTPVRRCDWMLAITANTRACRLQL